MTETKQAFSKNVRVVNDLGLHARSAAKIAEIARSAVSRVWVQKDQERADAKDILDILTLAGEKGSNLTIVIDNDSDMDILNHIVKLVQNGFGE